MPERNAKQAWMIPSAEALPNPVGTAPGWFVRHDGRVVAAMPGVPREMFRMWRQQVVPRMLEMLDLRAIRTTLGKRVRHRTSTYLNNRLEQDHRGIKGRYRPMRGFKGPRSAARFCPGGSVGLLTAALTRS